MPGLPTLTVAQRLTLILPTFAGTATAELVAGEPGTPFFVHAPLLRASAPFFSAALDSHFKEGKEQRILLPEDEPETVQSFVQWLYYQSYTLAEDSTQRFLQLAKLYIFADKILLSRLKDDIITVLFHLLRAKVVIMPPSVVIAYAFDNMPAHSSFRKILVDWYAWHVDLAWFEKPASRDSLTEVPQFTAGVLSRLAQRMRLAATKSPLDGEPDAYYESRRKDAPA